jgi:hypothetical protein
MLRLLLAVPVAWLAGLTVYVLALRLIWGQSLSDVTFVVVWSLIALTVAVFVAYWPVLTLLARGRNGYRPRSLFVVVAVALGVVPVAMLVFCWGGGLAELVSPEAQLFYFMFAAVGIVLGTAFVMKRESRTEQQVGAQ